MPTISAAVPTSLFVSVADPAISMLIGENAYVSLRYWRLGVLIELVSELSAYVGGRRWQEELDQQHTTDGDKALGIVCDLKYEAAKTLKIRDEPGYGSGLCDFQTTLERAFYRETTHAIAAE
jgi:hypothetical protein